MSAPKKILVSWYTHPAYIPPFILSPDQIVVGPKMAPDQPQMMFAGWTPQGRYDLKLALEDQKLPTQYDAIVVWADAGRTNLPLNLEAFDCPKVLCVGDTHHSEHPLQTMLDYTEKAHFDFILSSHNRQHLHWFAEAGNAHIAWLPGLKVRNVPRPFLTQRNPCVSFVGQMQSKHLRRRRLLSELKRKNIPLIEKAGSRDELADMSASSAVSLNVSLNGDLNLRVFEILSAGGALLTDRLSAQSGMDLLLREGKHYLAYGDAQELVDKANFLLNNSSTALDIARAGNVAFTSEMLPERRAQQLWAWIFEGKIDSMFQIEAPKPDDRSGAKLSSRVRLYEQLQELQRTAEAPRILFSAQLPEIYMLDALDLNRARISIGNFSSTLADDRSLETSTPYDAVSREKMEETFWDCVVTTASAPIPRGIAYLNSITL